MDTVHLVWQGNMNNSTRWSEHAVVREDGRKGGGGGGVNAQLCYFGTSNRACVLDIDRHGHARHLQVGVGECRVGQAVAKRKVWLHVVVVIPAVCCIR